MVLQKDPAWDSRANFKLEDFSVLDLVEQGHQPDDLGGKKEVGLVSLPTGAFLRIELQIHQHHTFRVRENGFAIANGKIIDVAVLRRLAKPN
jgi:hypothetical protein